jgi:protein-S-isoprenylcysteine O-methyltransferase Ste14
VFLDERHRIVRTIGAVLPTRISPRVRGARSVLELPAATIARSGLVEGAQVEIEGEPDDSTSVVDRVVALACNLVLAASFALFTYANFMVAWRTGHWATTMPLVVQTALLVLLSLIRRSSLASSARPLDWALGIAGTFLPLFLRPTDRLGPLNWIGAPLQVIGVTTAIVAAAFLGRSFGVIAGNRGIRRAGIYRLVRHPMYSAYMLGAVGYIASYPSFRNGMLGVGTFITLVMRASVEESFLRDDPLYQDYVRCVPWRFFPYVS